MCWWLHADAYRHLRINASATSNAKVSTVRPSTWETFTGPPLASVILLVGVLIRRVTCKSGTGLPLQFTSGITVPCLASMTVVSTNGWLHSTGLGKSWAGRPISAAAPSVKLGRQEVARGVVRRAAVDRTLGDRRLVVSEPRQESAIDRPAAADGVSGNGGRSIAEGRLRRCALQRHSAADSDDRHRETVFGSFPGHRVDRADKGQVLLFVLDLGAGRVERRRLHAQQFAQHRIGPVQFVVHPGAGGGEQRSAAADPVGDLLRRRGVHVLVGQIQNLVPGQRAVQRILLDDNIQRHLLMPDGRVQARLPAANEPWVSFQISPVSLNHNAAWPVRT